MKMNAPLGPVLSGEFGVSSESQVEIPVAFHCPVRFPLDNLMKINIVGESGQRLAHLRRGAHFQG